MILNNQIYILQHIHIYIYYIHKWNDIHVWYIYLDHSMSSFKATVASSVWFSRAACSRRCPATWVRCHQKRLIGPHMQFSRTEHLKDVSLLFVVVLFVVFFFFVFIVRDIFPCLFQRCWRLMFVSSVFFWSPWSEFTTWSVGSARNFRCIARSAARWIMNGPYCNNNNNNKNKSGNPKFST